MVNGQLSIDNWLSPLCGDRRSVLLTSSPIDTRKSTIDNYFDSGLDGFDGGGVGFDLVFVESVDEPELFSADDDSDLDLEDEELVEDPDFL
jgi:hypothetical protein